MIIIQDGVLDRIFTQIDRAYESEHLLCLFAYSPVRF